MIKQGLLLLALYVASALLSARAEYRVYQYLVKPRNAAVQVVKSEPRYVRSTLNPVAFYAYNGGRSSVDATLMRTWMCPGSTARRDYCPAPGDREETP